MINLQPGRLGGAWDSPGLHPLPVSHPDTQGLPWGCVPAVTRKPLGEGAAGWARMTGGLLCPQVLRQYSINLSEEEFFHVLEYYDKTLSSRVAYNDFLRAFLQ